MLSLQYNLFSEIKPTISLPLPHMMGKMLYDFEILWQLLVRQEFIGWLSQIWVWVGSECDSNDQINSKFPSTNWNPHRSILKKTHSYCSSTVLTTENSPKWWTNKNLLHTRLNGIIFLEIILKDTLCLHVFSLLLFIQKHHGLYHKEQSGCCGIRY